VENNVGGRYDLPSSTAPDLARGSRSRPDPGSALCGTGAPRLPEIQILWHRAIPFFGMSEESDPLLRHERLESDARLLRLERAMTADVEHRIMSERRALRRKIMKTASAPDEWHPEYESDEVTCAYTYDSEGPMCTGCEAVWKDEPFYGQVCRCCVKSARRLCRCHLSSIFKFPGT